MTATVWPAAPSDDSEPGLPWVASPGVRPGYSYKNFYDEQPALNFGDARPDGDEPWRQRPNDPDPVANRETLLESAPRVPRSTGDQT